MSFLDKHKPYVTFLIYVALLIGTVITLYCIENSEMDAGELKGFLYGAAGGFFILVRDAAKDFGLDGKPNVGIK